MVENVKKVLRRRIPRLWSLAARYKTRLAIEWQVCRQIGLRRMLVPGSHGADSWRKVLPLQSPRRITIPGADFTTMEEFTSSLDSRGVPFGQGYYTVYLPPASIRETVFRVVEDHFPPDAGLKILKAQGGVTESLYLDSVVHRKLSDGDRHLLLVANLLFSFDLGPRTYDYVEFQCGGQLWSAYVVQHVDGREPSHAECEAGVAGIRELETKELVETIALRKYEGPDFKPPTCNGNAIIDADGKFRYVDFQNFILRRYETFLSKTAARAVESSHFGERRLFGGGSFLYQSIPGVDMAAKRSIEDRVAPLRTLMTSAGVAVKDRLVLDVGCNMGMMMGQYLNMGAKWCHGWDFPDIASHAEKLLLALGCTRFSTTGRQLDRSVDLGSEVPDFLKPSLDGCVVSYLAIRRHVGWLVALGRIPWSFLLYEGHEGETREDFEAYLKELRGLKDFSVAGVTDYQDGVCRARTLAVLVSK